MKLKNIVEKYLSEYKFAIKKRTYLFYMSINEIYVNRYFDIEDDKISNEILNEQFSLIVDILSYSTLKIIKSLINRSLKFGNYNNLITIKLKQNSVKKINALTIWRCAHLGKIHFSLF